MPNNCTRKKHPERDAGGASGQSDLPLDATPSSLIKFLVDAKTKLQDDGADHLPILRVGYVIFPHYFKNNVQRSYIELQ